MAFDTVVRHDTDGSITLLDGTGTPVTIVVPFTRSTEPGSHGREQGRLSCPVVVQV